MLNLCRLQVQWQRQQRSPLSASPQSHHLVPQLLQVLVDVIRHHPWPVLIVQAVGEHTDQHLCRPDHVLELMRGKGTSSSLAGKQFRES